MDQMQLPRWMYVGNTVRPRGNTGRTPVLIVKIAAGKFWDEQGNSWKYGTVVNK
jgi:hypothetical protein